MSTIGDRDDDEYSVIGDKGEIGFIDYDDDRSVCSYNPNEEGPVIISVPFPFVAQKPRSVFVDEVAADSITIKNTTDDAVELWKVHIYASNPDESFTLSLMKPSEDGFVGSSSLEDRILQPRRTLTVWLSCKPKEIGLHTSIVQFDVDEDRIERVVFLLAEDKISKGLASNKPYQRGRKKGEFVIGSYVTGVRPSRPKHRNFKYKLPLYEIPKEARELLENKQVPEAVMHGLSRNNYVSYFKTLIMMEEIGLEEEMRAYDMECVSMKNKGRQYLILEVPGLAERRPSLVHGDSVFAKLATDDTDGTPAYEGCIHRVEADEVHLKFADVFHQRHIDKNLYNVRFRYNRINMRRMYQAIEAAEELDMQILFPSESPVKRHIKRSTVAPITHALNEEQLNAVQMVLGCKGGLPFVIYGPPGTGKTMTLVEIILQIYKSQRDARILVCASSNCAADHILEKILDLEAVQVRENEVFRLNAASRPYEDIKPDYIRFCFFEDCVFKCPPLQALLQYRIIITTYMSASSLYTEGIKRGHFSHIILDEAGQASEPETMIPISKLYDKGTVVALAGDPMQLGPVIYSKEAENFGLGSSYLQRLFDFELYYNRDESHVTKLIRNYRCHPEILCLPSNLFYEGDLIPCQEVSNSSLSWSDLLPNKEFPVLFIGIQGCDEREGNNPSWFNRIEVSKVVEIIKKLVARNVNEVDIGVITPYRQQVNKIRMVLEMLEMSEVKIGSVEQFQGQERDVIIVSTVRSTVKHNEFDRKHCLGFLSNPRRFNVAITRARSLLVIVGNPHIICKDPYWEQLLWRCVEYNSYQGCALPEKQSFPNEDAPNEENGFEGPEEQENKEWSEEAAVCDQEDPWTDDIPKPVKDEDEWSDGWK